RGVPIRSPMAAEYPDAQGGRHPMKTALLLSGGLDSTVLLYSLLNERHEVIAVSFDYGQWHGRRELTAARQIAARVEHEVLELPRILRARPEIPNGHYNDGRTRAMVWPYRHVVMLSVAD